MCTRKPGAWPAMQSRAVALMRKTGLTPCGRWEAHNRQARMPVSRAARFSRRGMFNDEHNPRLDIKLLTTKAYGRML